MPFTQPGSTAPPLPGGMGGAASAQPSSPNMAQLAGVGAGQAMQQTPGMSQISETTVRMATEIDQALKLLAQALPVLSPWVEKTASELRYQVGMAMQSGNVPTNPTPNDSATFPDGAGRV